MTPTIISLIFYDILKIQSASEETMKALKAKLLTRQAEKIEKRKEPLKLQHRKTLPKLITSSRQSLNIGSLVSPVILTPGALNLTPTQLLGGIKWLDIVSPRIQTVILLHFISY